MKKISYYILLLSITLSWSCQDDKEYNLNIPAFQVNLQNPADNSVIDLNDDTKFEYTFNWTTKSDEPCELWMSTSQFFDNGNVRKIDINTQNSQTLKAAAIDYYLAKFEIKGGDERIIYWTIKPKSNPAIASSQINAFTGKRAPSKLELPVDLSKMFVLRTDITNLIEFQWDADHIPTGTELEITFSRNPEFDGNLVKFAAGTGSSTNLTKANLQKVFEDLECEQYQLAELFWNVAVKSNGTLISPSSSILYLDGIMEFIDVRGSESITYRVTRLDYPNGTSEIWLADNLRTKYTAAGTPLVLAVDYGDYELTSFPPDKKDAYGLLYSQEVKERLAPEGWRLPSFKDYEKMYEQAQAANGTFLLYDPIYYTTMGNISDANKPLINKWRMNLSSSGKLNLWDNQGPKYEAVNANARWCYLLVTEPDICANHDNDGVYPSPVDGAGVRLIYVGDEE